jgi:hypothetical protein
MVPRYYLRLHARTSEDIPLTCMKSYRIMTAAASPYRDIRANMEQTRKLHGLDHYRRISTTTMLLVYGCSGTAVPEPLKRPIRSVTPAASSLQPAAVLISTIHLPSTVLCPLAVMPEALSNSERGRDVRTSAG